jgi:hypothetical protein
VQPQAENVQSAPSAHQRSDEAINLQPQADTVQSAPQTPAVATRTAVAPNPPGLAPQTSPLPANPAPAAAPVSIGSQPQAAPVSVGPQPQAAPVAPATTRTVTPPAQFGDVAEPLRPSQNQAQPLRSVSLEFTPDGAADVRLRLSERAGDVHIELHSTDPALSGRLSDGVHDLATSLADAGYDAQAWTPGQDREGGRGQQQENPSGKQRDQAADPDAEDFDTTMQEPIKEFS